MGMYYASPGSHVLSKTPTSQLHIAWICRNTGGTPGDALLRLFNLDRGGVVIASSPFREIATGGGSFTLQIDIGAGGLNPANFVEGQNDMVLELTSVEENPQRRAVHNFIINWSGGGGGGGGPVILPVGEPQIA